MNVQAKGFTIVGIMLAAAAVILYFFFIDMSENALMGASSRYRATLPATTPTDYSKAPQCAQGYDKTWAGCRDSAQWLGN
jgi:hypothetical protein